MSPDSKDNYVPSEIEEAKRKAMEMSEREIEEDGMSTAQKKEQRRNWRKLSKRGK